VSRETLISDIRFEVGQVDRLLSDYVDLLANARSRTPDRVEITAIAAVLHSFYNGVEKILLLAAKHKAGAVFQGRNWHASLLHQSALPALKQARVLSPAAVEVLEPYLAFRHVFRHSYSFHLDWSKMTDLVSAMTDVWQEVRADVQVFLEVSELE